MTEAVYPFSFSYATRNGEAEFWQESHKQNILCAAAVENAIRQGFDGMSLQSESARPVIAEFGFPRVQWVLANTLSQLKDDGRISATNKEWAADFFIEPDKMNGLDMNRDFVVDFHPAVLDIFINQVRREFQQQGLCDQSHCQPLTGEDITGQVAVLKLDALKQKYQKPEWQLFIPDSGFGCSPTASGRRVYGTFLKDGERASFYRQDFIGVLKPEHLPDWAKEKLAQQPQRQAAAMEEVYLCPLSVCWYPPGEDGYPLDVPEDLDISGATKYEDEIRATIYKCTLPEEAERGLMHWFEGSESIREKVTEIRPDVRLVGDTLHGAFVCGLRSALTPEERTEMVDFLAEQAENGWGDYFSQQPVDRLEGDLYFCFHSNDPAWSLRPASEVLGEQTQGFEMSMT